MSSSHLETRMKEALAIFSMRLSKLPQASTSSQKMKEADSAGDFYGLHLKVVNGTSIYNFLGQNSVV